MAELVTMLKPILNPRLPHAKFHALNPCKFCREGLAPGHFDRETETNKTRVIYEYVYVYMCGRERKREKTTKTY